MCFYKDLLRSTDFFFSLLKQLTSLPVISEGLVMNLYLIFVFTNPSDFEPSASAYKTYSISFYFLLFTFYLIKNCTP